MIPLTQTDFTSETGDCFKYCLASIMEVPPELLPNPHGDNGEWFFEWNRFLEKWNVQLLQFPAGGDYLPPGYIIAGGKSPRGNWLHATVYHDGKPVHDPHPSRAFCEDVQDYSILMVIDPSKPAGPGAYLNYA